MIPSCPSATFSVRRLRATSRSNALQFQISGVTAERIEDFIEAKRAPGGSARFEGKALSDASLRTGLLALRLILQRAVRTKLVTANPMHEVEWRGLPRMDDKNVDPFTVAELQAMLGAAVAIDADLATMLRLWAQCGMRAGEVCGLQWRDLDPDRGEVLARRTWSRQQLGPRRRVVSEPCRSSIPWSIRRASGVQGPLRTRGACSRASGSSRSARPLASMELHRAWRRVLAKARVRYRSPEQLRHTFASLMLSRNAPLLYLQQQGGWRSAGVLLRVYARWMPQDVSPREAQGQPAATPAQPEASRATVREADVGP